MTTQPEIDRLVSELGDPRKRAAARTRLREMGPEAAAALLKVLEQPGASANKRWAAISLLGACRHAPAGSVLVGIMRSEPSLRADARRALQAVTGEDRGEDADAWEAALSDAEAHTDKPAPARVPPSEPPMRERYELICQAADDMADAIVWEPPDAVSLVIATRTAGTCRLVVTFDRTDRKREPVFCIHSECGPATPTVQGVMFRHNVTLRHGHYAVEETADGAKQAVLRFCTSPDRFTVPYFRGIVLALVNDLEQLREELAQHECIYPRDPSNPARG